jgi:hypothetical protein
MGVPFSNWSTVLMPLLAIFDLPFSFTQLGKQRLTELYAEIGYVEFTKFSVLFCHFVTTFYANELRNDECFQLMMEKRPPISVNMINHCAKMAREPFFQTPHIAKLWSKYI